MALIIIIIIIRETLESAYACSPLTQQTSTEAPFGPVCSAKRAQPHYSLLASVGCKEKGSSRKKSGGVNFAPSITSTTLHPGLVLLAHRPWVVISSSNFNAENCRFPCHVLGCFVPVVHFKGSVQQFGRGAICTKERKKEKKRALVC